MSDLARAGTYTYGDDTVTVDYLEMWCPGCDDRHVIVHRRDDDGPVWDWNGSTETPTISPSILVNAGHAHPGRDICHSFVRDGQWQFLSDSTHSLAGQTVPMIPLTDRWPDGRDLTESN